MAKPARFGPSEPLHIFQDEMYENTAPMISHATMPPATKPPRHPLQNANVNIVLNPPNQPGAKHSPFKANAPASGSPPMPLTSGQGPSRLNMVPMMPPSLASRSTDNLEKKHPMMSNFKTVAKKSGMDAGLSHFNGKENGHLAYPMENYGGNSHGKRVLLEAAPIKELRPAKKAKLEDSLPASDSFPPIADDGLKPGHSYAQLIGMAILRSPQRRLTLAQIYKWISDTFRFYNPNDAGWQNSIRHNLSLNKNFLKQERPKDDPGKGNYWAIEPGAEHLFMKEKPARKTTATAENVPIMSTCLEPAQPPQLQLPPQLPLMSEPMMHLQFPMSQAPLPSLPASSQAVHPALPAEISSDATIPQSELAALDEMAEKGLGPDNHADGDLYSPLPAAMHSSPPIPKHMDPLHNDTPPPMLRSRGSSLSKSRSHKRKFASADDSGYISSLESSAMRPNQHSKLLTSEADRPRIKRGRAEEEIARLRASSYDSPTKSRSFGYAPVSSSPLRRTNEAGQMLPPLTPAMKLKAPPKPPPSVSPNTNLRLHRESVQSMIESSYRRADSIMPKDNAMFSLTPGFALDDIFDGLPRSHHDGLDFDIFQDSPFMPLFAVSPAVPMNGSPIKRSAKKQRMDRSQSTSALYDTTANAPVNVMSAASLLKASGQHSGVVIETPSKVFEGLPSSPSKAFLQSPSKMPLMNDENMAPWISMDELCGGEFLEDNDFTGIDIVAGFEKIGSSTSQMARSSRPSQKPPMGRSYTSTF